MKKLEAIALAVCLCLLASCAEPREDAGPAEAGPPAVYGFDPMTAEERFVAEDGQELAYYRYELQTMTVENREELSPEALEAAERNVESFNARMTELLDQRVASGRQLAETAEMVYDAGGSLSEAYYDELTSSVFLRGQICSVRVDTSQYAGGAHEFSYTSGFVLDLGTGKIIDPTQVADDPEAFRTGAVAPLVERADTLEENVPGYLPDYRETISLWYERAVVFGDQGMTVIFPTYDLGPYAMGPVELTVPYGDLAGLLGPGGLARLGLDTEQADIDG